MRESRRLAVVGVGLIGGSVGLAARRAGGWVVVGHDPAHAPAALAAGAIDAVADTAAAAADGADLLVVAVPVGAAATVLASLRSSGPIVTDVGSTKRSVVSAARRLGVRRFVGSHPMAGGHKGGVAHARADLFDGATCLLTPTDDTDPAAVDTVAAFWQSLGMSIRHLSPDEHDRQVADISHVPHAAAGAVARQADPAAVPLAAGGWRDTTRVAGGSPDLWRDILLDNRDHVTAALRRLRDDVDDLIGRLDAGDPAAVREWLARAAAAVGPTPRSDPAV